MASQGPSRTGDVSRNDKAAEGTLPLLVPGTNDRCVVYDRREVTGVTRCMGVLGIGRGFLLRLSFYWWGGLTARTWQWLHKVEKLTKDRRQRLQDDLKVQ